MVYFIWMNEKPIKIWVQFTTFSVQHMLLNENIWRSKSIIYFGLSWVWEHAVWTPLPHDFTSSLTLSLTLSSERLLKQSEPHFFSLHSTGREDGIVISLVLALVLTHLWGSVLREQTFTFTVFTQIFFLPFPFNFFLGRLTCGEEALGASQPVERCSKAVRTVFKNGFSLWGAGQFSREQFSQLCHTWDYK